MSLVIKTDNMESEEIPTGEMLARCYNIFDLGYQAAGDGNQPRREFGFLFELDALKKDGNSFTTSERFTASMHPKANLRAFIEAWRGAPYDNEEVKNFDASVLIGQYCFLTLVKKPQEKGKREWVGIFSIRPKGKAAPFMTRMQSGYVPEWIKKAIAKQLPPLRDESAGPRTEPDHGGPQDLPSRPSGGYTNQSPGARPGALPPF